MEPSGTSVSSSRWHDRVYPALGPEEAKRLFASLENKDRKIATLSETCDELGRRSYEQEQHILKLEAHIKYLESLKKSFEDIIVEKVAFTIPVASEAPEPFSS
jgi:hypothetical protein